MGSGVIYHDEAKMVEVADGYRLSRSSKAVSRERSIQMGKDCDAVFAKVLARNPGLIPEWKTIPDDENGFLQWLDFCGQHRADSSSKSIGRVLITLPDDMREMIDGAIEWDTELMTGYMVNYAELLAEITRIGLMPEQSTAGISVDRWAFLNGIIGINSVRLLCAAARLAAESGDAEEALMNARAGLGLARNLIQVETPSIVAGTIAYTMQLRIYETSINDLLPILTLDPVAVREWREAFTSVAPADLSSLMLAEYWACIRGVVIPMQLGASNYPDKIEINDPDALYDAYARKQLGAMTYVKSASAAELFESEGVSELVRKLEVPEESRELMDSLHFGIDVYLRGWTRCDALFRQYDAALAILAGDEPPVELLTGKAFLFDAKTRTLTFPSDPLLEKLKSKPIKLP